MDSIKRAKEILAAHKLGKRVNLNEIEEISMDLNDFKGQVPLKKRLRELRDSIALAGHMKGMWP